MNKDFFNIKYSKHITDAPNKDILQKDGFAYATSLKFVRPLLVLNDVEKTNIKDDGFWYDYSDFDSIKVVDFLDKGIMQVFNPIIAGKCQEVRYISSRWGDFKDEKYNLDRFDFNIKEVSKEEVVTKLRKVFYLLQPKLQGNTLVGGGIPHTKTDPNYYDGYYYLQDGEEYTILKYGSLVEFYKGHKPYTYLFSKKEDRTDYLYREEIDFNLYVKSIELHNLKAECKYDISEMLDYKTDDLINKINKIKELEEEIKNTLDIEA